MINTVLWNAILTHEAGHAVAAHELWDITVDIGLRQSGPDGYEASYLVSEIFTKKAFESPYEAWVVASSGFAAEKVCLDIDHSMGAKGDLAKMRFIKGICRDRMEDVLIDADERQNYQAAFKLIKCDEPTVKRLSKVALDSLLDLELHGSISHGTIILSSDQVLRCFD